MLIKILDATSYMFYSTADFVQRLQKRVRKPPRPEEDILVMLPRNRLKEVFLNGEPLESHFFHLLHRTRTELPYAGLDGVVGAATKSMLTMFEISLLTGTPEDTVYAIPDRLHDVIEVPPGAILPHPLSVWGISWKAGVRNLWSASQL
jgi:hypothetical protein